MIPKIAYFHWSQRGPEMSWLRWVSLQTFKKYNPDWDIRLIPTPASIVGKNLLYGQEADYAWWEALAKTGGFQVATDIVFTKPIPDDWRACDLNACIRPELSRGVYQFAMLGACPGNRWMRFIADRSLETIEAGGAVDYQDLGVFLLRKYDVEMYSMAGQIYYQPMSALCHIDDSMFSQLWLDVQHWLPPAAIGVHWYGGGEMSKVQEWITKPDTPNFLARLAIKSLTGVEGA